MTQITYDDFSKIEVRSGTVLKVELFPKAKKPAYKIWVDFGLEFGVLQTSAQVTVHYTPETLVGKQVAGVINIGCRNIAGFESQFLLLGFEDENGAICLVTAERKVPNGKKMH